jgi:hypothetical protein
VVIDHKDTKLAAEGLLKKGSDYLADDISFVARRNHNSNTRRNIRLGDLSQHLRLHAPESAARNQQVQPDGADNKASRDERSNHQHERSYTQARANSPASAISG